MLFSLLVLGWGMCASAPRARAAPPPRAQAPRAQFIFEGQQRSIQGLLWGSKYPAIQTRKAPNGKTERFVTLRGAFQRKHSHLVINYAVVSLNEKGRFEVELPLKGAEADLVIQTVDPLGDLHEERAFIVDPSLAKRVLAEAGPMDLSLAEGPSLLPPMEALDPGPKITFLIEPQYFTLKQTLQGTQDQFNANGMVSNQFDFLFQTSLTRMILLDAELGYQSLSNNSLAQGNYTIQSSNFSVFTPKLAFEQRNVFGNGSELRPILGVALEQSPIFDFQGNTELALDSAESLALTLGLDYRFQPFSRSQTVATLGVSWERGLGTLSGGATQWQSSNTFSGKCLIQKKLSRAWDLNLGLGISSANASFMNQGDSWTQSYLSLTGVFGLTFHFNRPNSRMPASEPTQGQGDTGSGARPKGHN